MVKYSKYHTKPFEHCWFGIDKEICKNYVNKHNKFLCYFSMMHFSNPWRHFNRLVQRF